MELDRRIAALGALGSQLIKQGGVPDAVALKAKVLNPWFTVENVQKATTEIAKAYLDQKKLTAWLSTYTTAGKESSKRVGLLLAGNIPLVGFHDVLCTYVAGHKAMIKASERDQILLEYVLTLLREYDEQSQVQFQFVERLADYEAVIATGSDSSGRYFRKYFGAVPNIIRMNRNGIAVIYNDTTEEGLENLGRDIFAYFGMGCRNVSKLYLEKGFDIQRIFAAIEKHRDIIHHHKYKNNYDYNFALYLLNKDDFLTNDFLVMRENADIGSRIAALHYSYFEDYSALHSELQEHKEEIQCVISDRPVDGFKVFDFGEAQQPALSDYADGVDTLEFLLEL